MLTAGPQPLWQVILATAKGTFRVAMVVARDVISAGAVTTVSKGRYATDSGPKAISKASMVVVVGSGQGTCRGLQGSWSGRPRQGTVMPEDASVVSTIRRCLWGPSITESNLHHARWGCLHIAITVRHTTLSGW